MMKSKLVSGMSIAGKLRAAFAIMMVLLLLLALFAYTRLAVVQGEALEVGSNWLPATEHASALHTDIAEYRISLLQHMAATTPQQTTIAQGNMDAAAAAYKEDSNAYAALVNSADERGKYEAFNTAFIHYEALAQQVVAMVKAGEMDDARALQGGEARNTYREAVKQVRELVTLNISGADASVAHGAAVYQRSAYWLTGAAVLAFIIALLMAASLVRTITQPLLHAVEAADRVADGDLSESIEVRGNDEIAHLLEAMRRMQQSLVATVGKVRSSARSVASASAEIAQGNANLSSRTEDQAASLEETSATMEQLNATVRQNADNASQANQLAQSASQVARDGGQVVGDVVTTMRGIEDSSQRIADIISVIDGIAFQTNILALNAAVEAARAGEQGRGFAVVASEVRNLAQRSAAAAKEIKGLITDSVERVQNGTALVDRAGQTIRDVVNSVQKLADLVGEISSASREQSSGISQVGEAVTQLDQATQQNAALVEESAAASESLKGQAAELLTSVASFKLGADGQVQRQAQPYSAPAAPTISRPALVAPTHKARTVTAARPPAALRRPATAPATATSAAAAPRPAARAEVAAEGDWTSF